MKITKGKEKATLPKLAIDFVLMAVIKEVEIVNWNKTRCLPKISVKTPARDTAATYDEFSSV